MQVRRMLLFWPSNETIWLIWIEGFRFWKGKLVFGVNLLNAKTNREIEAVSYLERRFGLKNEWLLVGYPLLVHLSVLRSRLEQSLVERRVQTEKFCPPLALQLGNRFLDLARNLNINSLFELAGMQPCPCSPSFILHDAQSPHSYCGRVER